MVRRTVLAMALAAVGVSGKALADGTFAQPVKLNATSSSVTVDAAITNASETDPDVDYYAFEGKAGDRITVDIDGTTDLDANVFLFRPDGTLAFWSMDTDPRDAGSNPPPGCPDCTGTADPLIDGVRLDQAGTWIIAVSASGAFLMDGGAFEFAPFVNTNGSYSMIVSGLSTTPTPPPAPVNQQVNIDIKPRQAGPATVNTAARGLLPIVLLSDNAFDPFTVDPASLRFGKTGEEFSYKFCAKEGWDLNHDGKRDRLCFFDPQRTGLLPGDTIGVLKGITGGRWVEGKGDLKVVAEKRARYEKERQKYEERKKHKHDRHANRGRGDRNDD
jgi:pre-peptidase